MSRKLRKANAEEEAECVLDMSPMIDMVFLLLIFFIVNATAIIVQTDPKVKPPIATFGKNQEDRSGRIVVNIRADGSFSAEDFNTILPDEDAIIDYVKKSKDNQLKVGAVPKLHLRGDKDAVFRYARQVVRSAAVAGVNEVVFGVYTKEP